jgi:sulfur relay (sulfurtransferase) DsrC/TusE family protein
MKTVFVITDIELNIPLVVTETEDKAMEYLLDYCEWNRDICDKITDRREYLHDESSMVIRTIIVRDYYEKLPTVETTFKIIEVELYE